MSIRPSFVKMSSSDAKATYAKRDKSGKIKEPRDWKVEWAQADVAENLQKVGITQINYRPFDKQWTMYSGKSRGLICFPRQDVMKHYRAGQNFGLLVPKGNKDRDFRHVFVTTEISEAILLSSTTGSNAMNLPLYLYPSEQDLDQTRRVNFDPKIHKAIVAAAKDKAHGAPDEVAIFDYIYGVLHCPAYRETYKEFLKIGFPRVPYPPSPEVFWDVSAKGTALRKLHLMEDAAIGETPYKFTGAGDSVVGKVEYEGGVARINKTQGFEGVPEIAWNFHIGGYQPAQKWLKDRKGRELSFEDIRHYQKIIKILSETDRVMKTITMPLDSAK
jgi:predicted helicase